MPQRDFEELLFDVGGNLISTGSANAYAVETAQSVNDYYDGLWLRIRANHTNNGASTLEINGLGIAADIVKNVSDALIGGEIVSGQYFDVVYNEAVSAFQLQNSVNGVTNGQLADMAEATIKGRQAGGGTGAPEDLTGVQAAAILPDASETQRGVAEMTTDGEIYSAASGAKAIMAEDLGTAAVAVALVDAAPVAVDWKTGINFSLTITASRAIGNPTNGIPGTHRTIMVQGNDGTDRAITFGNEYLGDVPTITDCDSGKWYLLMIYCHSTTHFVVSAKVAKS